MGRNHRFFFIFLKLKSISIMQVQRINCFFLLFLKSDRVFSYVFYLDRLKSISNLAESNHATQSDVSAHSPFSNGLNEKIRKAQRASSLKEDSCGRPRETRFQAEESPQIAP